ncbi:MAG: hypothetical protein JWO38_4880 [Gemmataceae bacterium]|nr:hypothetical protein [Gemmataceae bacterium]
MPLLTLLAPGCPVAVSGLELPGAVVVAAELTTGLNPLTYDVEWQDDGSTVKRRQRFHGDSVQEVVGGPVPPVRRTVLAPGTAVTVSSMDLPKAVVTRVGLKPGQVLYDIDWQGDGATAARKARFHADAVQDRPATASRPGTAGRLAQLGGMLADLVGEGGR